MPLKDQENSEFLKEHKNDIKRVLGKKYTKADSPENIVSKYIAKAERNYIIKMEQHNEQSKR